MQHKNAHDHQRAYRIMTTTSATACNIRLCHTWASEACTNTVVFAHLQAWTQKPRWHYLRQLLVPSARQTNRPKRALTSICVEVTY